MVASTDLIAALDERRIAHEVALAHDEARIRFPLHKNTVGDYAEFADVIGSYYSHHFTRCVSHGGSLPRSESASRAKAVLEREYRRRGGNVVSAFNDAHDGTNGGLRGVLDLLNDALKAESIEHYIRDVFDHFVAPSSWPDKVALMRDFLARYGANLSPAIHPEEAERYAQDYEDLIRAFTDAVRRTSTIFRRL